jgi:hypothetical protein
MQRRVLIAALLLLATGTGSALAADEPRWSLSTSFNYSVGDYGTGEDTELIYVPLTLGVRPIDRLTVSLTIPYIRQTTETVVVTGGGVAVRKDKKQLLATSARGDVTSTEDGLGDILLKGQYVILEETAILPEISPYLKIKFPTADDSRGLGTGEFDETIGVDLSKTLFPNFVAYLALAYTFIGSPAGSDFDNSFGWSVGGAYQVARGFNVFAFLDGATAIASGQDDPLELRVGVDYRFTQPLKAFLAITRGISDGSADWSVSAGLNLRF